MSLKGLEAWDWLIPVSVKFRGSRNVQLTRNYEPGGCLGAGAKNKIEEGKKRMQY